MIITSYKSQVTNHKTKVGITGQPGFMGTHLFNYLHLKDGIECVPFEDRYFEDDNLLNNFVKECDVIVHLAAMNRHNDPKVIYETNIRLVEQLIKALDQTKSSPHIIFSSSTQEESDNLYGKSKKEGRELLANWVRDNNSVFTGMVIPNVFGPFGHPYYNSVVATFCHQLTHNEEPRIQVDGHLKLIYINELIEEFHRVIQDDVNSEQYMVKHTSEKKVSEVLDLLNSYKELYFNNGVFPDLSDPFELSLFNTFVCYMDLKRYYPFKLKKQKDDRGMFVEMIKLNSGGQVSFSTTKPGITRGNHFHIRKAERFAVIKGKALIQLRRIGTDEVLNFELDGEEPSYVDMPIWYTHNIKNIGDEELLTIFWINEQYNPEDPDTYFEGV